MVYQFGTLLQKIKGNQKMLVMQLAQVQVLGARLIIGAFRATSMQVLNIEAYLTLIGLELDKKNRSDSSSSIFQTSISHAYSKQIYTSKMDTYSPGNSRKASRKAVG